MSEGIKDLVKIKVIGVGGGGGNAINDMLYSGVTGVEYIAANTDKQDLEKSLADRKLQIGEKLTKGQGAGAEPEIGRLAAEEDIEKIQELLKGTDMLFITAGMGGGTGTGAAPVIAKVAKELDVLTVAVVTRPFNFEGEKRRRNSESGIELLRQNVDSLVIIPNDKLFDLPDKNITMLNAFKEANNILRIGIKAVVDLVLGQGFINLDFADIKSVLKNSGIAVLGYGEGEGENRAIKAAEKALESPLLEKSIQGADKILINLRTSEDVGLNESQTVTEVIRQATGKKVEDVLFGITIVPEFSDKIEITIMANNFKDEMETNNETFIKVEPVKTTEIKATLKAIKSVDNSRLVAIFQPHRYSRVHFLLDEFKDAFVDVDKVILLPIYAAGEKNEFNVSSEILKEHINHANVELMNEWKDIKRYVTRVKKDSTYIFMGAGDISTLAHEIAEELEGMSDENF